MWQSVKAIAGEKLHLEPPFGLKRAIFNHPFYHPDQDADSLSLKKQLRIICEPDFTREFRGDRSCGYGQPGCNACARQVREQFGQLAVDPDGTSGRFAIRTPPGDRPVPPARETVSEFTKKCHVQGFARIADPDEHNWFVLSRSTSSDWIGGCSGGEAGFLICRLSNMDGNGGERMIEGVDRTTFLDTDASGGEVVSFVATEKTTHPGGIQVLGTHLFVPGSNKEEGAWVDRYDLSDKRDPEHLEQIILPPDLGALYVCAVRLHDGRVLLLVNRADDGKFDLLITAGDEAAPESPWLYLGRDDFSRFEEWYAKTGRRFDNFAYQCASLVTECGTGAIYLLAFRQHHTKGPVWDAVRWQTPNRIDLFRVQIHEPEINRLVSSKEGAPAVPGVTAFDNRSILELEHSGRRIFGYEDGCRMRGGSGAHVTPSGQLIVYCGPHTEGDNKLRFGEITA